MINYKELNFYETPMVAVITTCGGTFDLCGAIK